MIVESMIYDLTRKTIIGYQMGEDEPYRLELIPGDRYEIHYGIHQGIYIYEGVVSDNYSNRKNYPHSIGEYMFRSVETGEVSFGFYPKNNESLFTRICKHVAKKKN